MSGQSNLRPGEREEDGQHILTVDDSEAGVRVHEIGG